MPLDPEVQRQFIRIAIGYVGLGVFIATAVLAVLSTVALRHKRGNRRSPIVELSPPWFKKALLTSLVLEIVVGSVLAFKDLVNVDTKAASESAQDAVERKGVAIATQGIEDIGILKYFRRSNDFLPEVRLQMAAAQHDIWISGASFYLSVPDNEDILIERATHGVNINYLFLDPLGDSLGQVSRTFNQTPDELRMECLTTIRGLLRVRDRLSDRARGNLNVRLFDESPRARFYFFDPQDPKSVSFFVPHVNSVNSPALPGFLLSNRPFGLAQLYFASLQEFWAGAKPLEDWLRLHRDYTDQKPR